jgi:hypothetical protein
VGKAVHARPAAMGATRSEIGPHRREVRRSCDCRTIFASNSGIILERMP